MKAHTAREMQVSVCWLHMNFSGSFRVALTRGSQPGVSLLPHSVIPGRAQRIAEFQCFKFNPCLVYKSSLQQLGRWSLMTLGCHYTNSLSDREVVM